MTTTEPATGDRVYRYLWQAIVTGDLRAGTRLVEDQLSQQLSVSRTPVREAIQRLNSRGLVTRVRRGQVEVRYVSQAERNQLHELRLKFDEVAAGLIAERVKEIDWVMLYGLLDPIEVAFRAGGLQSPQLAIAHMDFHVALNREAFDNGVAALVISEAFLYIIDSTIQPPDFDPVADHRMLLDKLRAGGKRGALAAMREHARLKVA